MKALARLISIQLAIMIMIVPVAAGREEQAFSREELDQMLAPIALYPDVLLSQILMASTYPLEVVEAARWSRENRELEGEAAANAVADRDWDPSVKALVAFPHLLSHMDEDLEWLKRLGDAFLFQEAQVMDAIQSLRQKAYAAGNLDTLAHVRVARDQREIVLEPVSPQIIYVPYYNPAVIYGAWRWPAYPPYYWAAPPGYYVNAGFFWGSAIRISPRFFYSTVHWPRRQIVTNHRHYGRADFILRKGRVYDNAGRDSGRVETRQHILRTDRSRGGMIGRDGMNRSRPGISRSEEMQDRPGLGRLRQGVPRGASSWNPGVAPEARGPWPDDGGRRAWSRPYGSRE